MHDRESTTGAPPAARAGLCRPATSSSMRFRKAMISVGLVSGCLPSCLALKTRVVSHQAAAVEHPIADTLAAKAAPEQDILAAVVPGTLAAVELYMVLAPGMDLAYCSVEDTVHKIDWALHTVAPSAARRLAGHRETGCRWAFHIAARSNRRALATVYRARERISVPLSDRLSDRSREWIRNRQCLLRSRSSRTSSARSIAKQSIELFEASNVLPLEFFHYRRSGRGMPPVPARIT